MYISSFHINGFGIFNNVSGEGLQPGISIFFGKNEAGKSTCLEFFRTMLTGYPEKNKIGSRSFEPLNGGRPGGSLLLQWQEGSMCLFRAPAAYGGLRLNSPDGQVLHADKLDKLLGGIDRTAYRRVFGFSLDELERWDKKDNESIRNALYGATFGPGLVPPGEVLDTITKEMGKIYKPRGATQPLSVELDELAKIHTRIAQLQKEYSQYNDIANELVEQKQIMANASAKREDLELARLRLERRQGVRQQWEQWNILRHKLAKLPEAPSGFPEDAQARLARLQTERSACERDVAEAKERLRQIICNVDAIAVNTELLAELAQLRRLAERKNSYRQAASQIALLEEIATRAEESLRSGLAQLGPDWDCERIRNTDRSIFTREGIEKQATEMGEARMGHQAALASLTSANREVDLAQANVEKAETALAAQHVPDAPLSDEDRERLRTTMTRLDESRKLASRRASSLENARHMFMRALEQVQIFGTEIKEDSYKQLDSLLQHQDEALAVAAEIQRNLRESEEADATAEKSAAAVEAMTRKYEEMQNAGREMGNANRDTLDARAMALRSLRSVAASMSAEESHKKELEARIAQEKMPSSIIKNWVLISFALVFLIASGGIFIAYWFFDIHNLDFGNGMGVPLNLWASYAALFCGVVLMAGGFSAYGPEQKRQKMEMARLLSRSETSSMHLAELAEQSRKLCAEAGVDDPDPIALDAMEMLLEREKEQLYQDEHSARELAALRDQLENAKRQAEEDAQTAQEKSSNAQLSRRRWHGIMQTLGVDNVPAPESAATLFARAEAAHLAYESVLVAQQELDAYGEELQELEQSITVMPTVAAFLENAEETISLEEAVTRILSGCKEADQALAQRMRCAADLDSAKNELERAIKRQGEAYNLLEELATKLTSARHNWAKCLDRLGMSSGLDPESVRAAYKCMGECLADEENMLRAKRELAQARQEMGALEEPLTKILAKFQLEAKIDAEARPDWISTLDKLLADAEEQARQKERQDNLQENAAVQKTTIAAKEAALEQAKKAEQELIGIGGATNADEFLAQAALRNNRRSLADRLDDLEAVLNQAARGENLEAFLTSFEKENQEEEEKKLLDIRNNLNQLAQEEKNAAAKIGNLEARTAILANSDELANLRQQEKMLVESARRKAEQWSALALAKILLQKARNNFEKERQPRIIRMASEIFNRITDGHWRGLSLNLEDSSLMMLPTQGEPVQPYNLSRGAQEQAYLAFRLAYIREHAQTREALPVIMDEILVNFDQERATRTAQALANLAGDGKQQILYFTCQPHIVEMLQNATTCSSLFLIENGKILAA